MGLLAFCRDGATVATVVSGIWLVATKLNPRNNWCVFALGGMPGESIKAMTHEHEQVLLTFLHWCLMTNNNTHQASSFIWPNACVCDFVCVSVTCGCPGGELGIKMKCVFGSSHRRFKWRPYFLLVEFLLRKTTVINISSITRVKLPHGLFLCMILMMTLWKTHVTFNWSIR